MVSSEVIHVQVTGWQSSVQLCIMPRLFTHLVQESKVGTVDVRMVPIQLKQKRALKELPQFVRILITHSSCRKMVRRCTAACGSSKGVC